MSDDLFSRYNKSFQECIFQALITDSMWAQAMAEVMEPNYFELKYLKFLGERYFAYYKKYKSFPTLPLLVTIVKEDLRVDSDRVLRDQIIDFLHRIKFNPDVGNLPYVKEKTLDFCKRQALKDALEKAVDLIDNENYDTVVDLMKNAVAVGIPTSTGHDFFQDIEARFVKLNRNTCPTGIAQLDRRDILNGGLGRGELGVMVGGPGAGKSHSMVCFGANALRLGKNVLHYTFELSEHAVGLRYDSNLCGISATDVQDSKELILEKYKEMELGRLIIKEYPTNYATTLTLRSHIEKLMLKGFTPSMIIVDYADIMRSTHKYDSLRFELKLIYEELRGLGMELNIPIWTCSQSNKDGATADVIDLTNMSEAYGKAMVADVVLSISRKSKEKSTGFGRLYVAKNRAGRDGIVFPMKMDTSMSTIEIVSDPDSPDMTPEDAARDDDRDMKKLLRDKLKQING